MGLRSGSRHHALAQAILILVSLLATATANLVSQPAAGAAEGDIATVAGTGVAGFSGDGGQATVANLNLPMGIDSDEAGNLYIADYYNWRVRKVDPSGVITTVAGNGGVPSSITLGDGGPATAAGIGYLSDIAVGPDTDSTRVGVLYMAMSNASTAPPPAPLYDGAIRYVDRGGNIWTLAGQGTNTGDNIPPDQAQLQNIQGLAIAPNGDIYFSEMDRHVVRKYDRAANRIVRVAGTSGTFGFAGDGGAALGATLWYPTGVALDTAGNLYIADSWNNRIRKVDPSGTITTLASGLSYPRRLSLDPAGFLLVPSSGSDRVFRIDTSSGSQSVVAGTGTAGFSGDGGPATSAQLNEPWDVEFGFKGDIYIADEMNHRVRRIQGPDRAFLAEGATAGGFDTWVLLSNPYAVPAQATVTFLTGAGPVAGPTLIIPPLSRRTVHADSYVPDSYDVSTSVSTTAGRVFAERALYSSQHPAAGAHLAKAVTQPSRSWFLAEGATAGGFETWVLVMNPSSSDATVSTTFLTGAGPVAGPSLVLPSGTRRSIRVNDYVTTFDVSTKVESTGAPVIAERALYVDNGVYRGATDSVGKIRGELLWYLAEGATAGGFDTWILVANPGPNAADGILAFSDPLAPPVYFSLAPGQRQSFKVNDYVAPTFDVATIVISWGEGVIVERAMYANHPTYGMTAASAEGMHSGFAEWALPEGAAAGPFETWILALNAGPQTANVTARFLGGGGELATHSFSLAPGQRHSFKVNDFVSPTYDVSVKLESTGGWVFAEHSVYQASPGSVAQEGTGGPGLPAA